MELTTLTRNAKVAAATTLMSGGRIKFLTAGSDVVAELALGTPAFSTPGGGQAALIGPVTDPFTAAGTVASFSIETSAGAVVLTGDVTTTGGGGDIELQDLEYSVGDRLKLDSLVYAQPASQET